jgi:hypothetical protein
MGTEFEDALAEVTGASTPPATSLEQAQAPEATPEAPATEPATPAVVEGNPFDQALAEAVQQLAPEVARDLPEPGGGLEH